MSKRKIPIIISIVCGALSTPLAYFSLVAVERGTEAAYSVWLWYMYPVLLLISVFLGYRWPFKAWQYGVLAIISSYISAFVIIPGVGSLLPFEIIMELLYSIPAAIAGWLGEHMSKRKSV